MAVSPRLELTSEEQQLFDTLLAASKQAGFPTTLRCAGGWVRDKLMGRASDDIDVALDDALGSAFAEAVNGYLAGQGQGVHSVAVIAANPGQSKHLETARMRVHGLWLDLVNLRCEEYAAGSRIPAMRFGTPRQDAERRDFTINALFYNINSGEVEDLTGRGLADLEAGVIRTPLPPRQTLLDDPLRALRAVRFAARFGFELEESLVHAAAHPEIASALEQKVSRERVGTEVDGMLGGPEPVAALDLLRRLGLMHAVFGHDLGTDGRPGVAWEALRLLDLGLGREARRDLMAAAALLPVREERVPAAKGRHTSLAASLLRTALKWPTRSGERVEALHAAAPQLLQVLQEGLRGEDGAVGKESLQVTLGRCLLALKDSWREGCLLGALLGSPTDPAGTAEGCRSLVAAVGGWGLQGCWEWKPPVNGRRVMALLGVSGKEVGPVMAAITDWQLAQPGGSARECEAWLLTQTRWAPSVREATAPEAGDGSVEK
ncbi:hypothetical protein ACKKBF_B05770 [Auxenochlorella protothecoides x Auxenochlorella symbiontica]